MSSQEAALKYNKPSNLACAEHNSLTHKVYRRNTGHIPQWCYDCQAGLFLYFIKQFGIEVNLTVDQG